MATGENKAGLATALALALALLLLLMPPAFPSHLLLIHHRLLPMHSVLLCDGRRASDGEDEATASRLAFPAAEWKYKAAMAAPSLSCACAVCVVEWLSGHCLAATTRIFNGFLTRHLASWGR
jgi:hypothetical protein